ncbi:hypothetical protein [Actinomadura sp. DC4]|uniref:hypothetical protein n=1 Tax=Actinomadura sp. DC4 TaxID=3055069 RepID=UPI0025AF3B95|nr:hypothetical protein [Actinomadura sp. DC4]MDN3355620.1 hypothetical protein [Actinomadura sp. DC4]
MPLTAGSLASFLIPYWPDADVSYLKEQTAQVRAHAESLRSASGDIHIAARTAGSGNDGPATEAVSDVLTGPQGHAQELHNAAAQADRLADGLQHYAVSVEVIRALVLIGIAAVTAATIFGPEAGLARLLAYQTQAKTMRNAVAKKLAEVFEKAEERGGGTIMKMGRKDGWSGDASKSAKSVANEMALGDKDAAERAARKLDKDAARAPENSDYAKQQRAAAHLKRTGQDN